MSFFRGSLPLLSVMNKPALNAKLFAIEQVASLFVGGRWGDEGRWRRVVKRRGGWRRGGLTLLKVAWSMSCLQRDGQTVHSKLMHELGAGRRKLRDTHTTFYLDTCVSIWRQSVYICIMHYKVKVVGRWSPQGALGRDAWHQLYDLTIAPKEARTIRINLILHRLCWKNETMCHKFRACMHYLYQAWAIIVNMIN